MKILLCARAYNSIQNHKVGVFEFDQAKALRSAGHDVRIAAIDIRSIRHRRKLASYSYECEGIKVFTTNIPAGRLPSFIMNRVLKRAGQKTSVLACADGWRPDVMHAHFSECGFAFADTARKLSVPYVITEHSSSLVKDRIAAKTARQASCAYDKADAVLAVSRHLSDRINQVFGVKPIVVYNTIEMPKVSEAKKAKDDYIFLSASNLLYGKGMDLLIEAFSRMKNAVAKLIIMGDGPEKNKLKQQIKKAGLSDRVSFTGRYTRQQFAHMLRQSDAFVLASRGETFGVVYAEALLMGVPVIATKCGGPEEYVNSQNGVLVESNNIEALRLAMEQMILDDEKYDRTLISQEAKSMFSPETIVSQLISIYSNLI